MMDSLILCKFLRGVFDDPFAEWAALLAPVTGWDVDARRAARHRPAASCWPSACSTCARAGRRGRHAAARMLETPLELGSGRTAVLTADRLRAMVGGYYAARGWDAEGRPARDDLAGLRLDHGDRPLAQNINSDA